MVRGQSRRTQWDSNPQPLNTCVSRGAGPTAELSPTPNEQIASFDTSEMNSESESSLLNTIREYPILYDKSQKGFRNKIQKANAWKKIAEKMNKTVEECQVLDNITLIFFSKAVALAIFSYWTQPFWIANCKIYLPQQRS